MPQGSTAPEAPDSDSLIPTPRVSQAPGSTAYPTVEPTRPRSSTIPPTSRALPAEALNYRKLYEHKFRDCSVDDRIALASQAVEADLLALCLDSSTRVIHALLQNPHFGLDHARTVAAHHGTPQGLEQLARHAQFLRDAHVARRLLQNPQLPDAVLLRSLAGRQLLGIYRAGVDRDLPERNRTRVRAQLRIHFSRAEPNERASLIIKTEGRCLGQLAGSTFDGKTTALLCHHNYASTLLIQNLARFSATPPAVLQKLLRCGPVRRQAQLRTLVQRHPNCSNSSGDP